MADNALKEGVVLDSGAAKYRIVKVLGQGGFGITYLVMGELRVGNVTTEAKFAIKEHFPSAFCMRVEDRVLPRYEKLAEYERSKADFIAEARKLHALGTQNDNIVKVNEVFEMNGTAYYVMQYINGQSLASYVAMKGKLSYHEALKLLAPIFDAVDFLHKSRINHLDIKPDNIMLHAGLHGIVPVLIDFGLSVHFKRNGDKTSPKGVQGVSEGYSPLEQYAGIKEFIPATDIYALMATLLYCITGATPKSAAELRLPEIRSSLAKIVPQDAIAGICKGLNKSYEDRTASIAVLKSDLGLSAAGGTDTTVLDIADSGKSRVRTIAYSIVAICAVVIVLLLWSKGKGASTAGADAAAGTPDTAIIKNEAPADSAPGQEAAKPTVTPEPSQAPEPKTEPQPAKPEKSTEPAKPVPAKPAATTTGTLDLGYGTWTGGIKNGEPDGRGKIVFSAAHCVDRTTTYEANPGDYFVATYDNGQLISGKLYDTYGNLIKTIIP